MNYQKCDLQAVTLNFSFLWIVITTKFPPKTQNIKWAPKFVKMTGYSSPSSFDVLFSPRGNHISIYVSQVQKMSNNLFGSDSHMHSNWPAKRALSDSSVPQLGFGLPWKIHASKVSLSKTNISTSEKPGNTWAHLTIFLHYIC